MIDVPSSVTAVRAESLASAGLVRLEDYAAEVPGMSITALSRGFTSVVLRGISTGISQATPATAFYVDEAPVGSITAYATGSTVTPDLDPYDLRRVEVLKGPQGTMYGAGAVGGLVRYVTAAPDPERFGGQISLGANKVTDGGDGYEGRVSLNVPLVSKTLAMRVSLMERNDAGYIDNPAKNQTDVNKAKTRAGRLALGWAIDKDWMLQTSVMTQRFKADGIGMEDVVGTDMHPLTGKLQHASYIPETQSVDFTVGNATLKGRIGEFSVVSSTTYQKISSEVNVDQTASFGPVFNLLLGIPGLGAQTRQQVQTKRWAQELRAGSTALSDKLDYEGGLFFTQEESSNALPPLSPFIAATGTPFTVLPALFDARIDSKYKEVSLFGNATYAVTPQFDLLGGLRVSQTKQNYHQDYKASLLNPLAVLLDQDVSSNKTNFLVGARYKPDANTAVYVRVATGNRPGGASALPPGVVTGGKQSFDADTVTSYELGFKSNLAGGKASIEAAVFTTDWKDVQAQTSATKSGATYQYFVNGGTARSRGAETTLLVFPVKDLTLRLTAAYTDARLTEDAPALQGMNGDRMPFVPRVTASFGTDYRFEIGSYPAWIGGSANYIGSRVSTFGGKGPLNVPAYTTVNLNTGADIGAWRVTLYGKNLNNAHGINFANNTAVAAVPFNAGIIQPRTIGGDVSYRF
nr:TonB-dependent receptor [Pelomonas aquatica]